MTTPYTYLGSRKLSNQIILPYFNKKEETNSTTTITSAPRAKRKKCSNKRKGESLISETQLITITFKWNRLQSNNNSKEKRDLTTTFPRCKIYKMSIMLWTILKFQKIFPCNRKRKPFKSKTLIEPLMMVTLSTSKILRFYKQKFQVQEKYSFKKKFIRNKPLNSFQEKQNLYNYLKRDDRIRL